MNTASSNSPVSSLREKPVDVTGNNPRSKSPFPHRDEFEFKGTINFAENQLDRQTATLQIRALVKNENKFLTPGLFARVRVPVGEPVERLLVKDAALGFDQDKRFAWIMKTDNTVEKRYVETGPLDGDLHIITSGLEKDELIAISGIQLLRPGMPFAPNTVPMIAEECPKNRDSPQRRKDRRASQSLSSGSHPTIKAILAAFIRVNPWFLFSTSHEKFLLLLYRPPSLRHGQPRSWCPTSPTKICKTRHPHPQPELLPRMVFPYFQPRLRQREPRLYLHRETDATSRLRHAHSLRRASRHRRPWIQNGAGWIYPTTRLRLRHRRRPTTVWHLAGQDRRDLAETYQARRRCGGSGRRGQLRRIRRCDIFKRNQLHRSFPGLQRFLRARPWP